MDGSRHQEQHEEAQHPLTAPVRLLDPTHATPPPTERRDAEPLSNFLDFASAWPEVRRSLLAGLLHRVDPATAEDICQDVAERVLRSGLTFDDVAGLRRWARHVARTRLIDDWRTRGRYLSSEPLPDQEAPTDLPTVVAYRLALEETAAALGSVRPHEWAAMFADPDRSEPADKRSRDREHLRRFRARERLRKAVRNFPGAVALRWRWFHRQQAVLADLGHAVVGAAVSAVLLTSSAPGPTPARSVATLPPRLVEGADAVPGSAMAPASPPAADPGVAGRGRPSSAARATPGVAKDWAVASIPHPGGAARVGFVDNGPQKPLLCAGTESTGPACVPRPASPLVLPLSLP